LALPLSGALLVSREALDMLDDRELAALCAHELGHLSESRAAAVTRLLSLPVLLGLGAIRPIAQTLGWPAALLLPSLLLLVTVTFQRFWRRLEQRSDEVAVRHEIQPGAFARALEKLYAFNLVPAVMHGKRTTHPHLYDRLLAAGITPSYARPAPRRCSTSAHSITRPVWRST
jgi:Zn-dependent protease with chaperone function